MVVYKGVQSCAGTLDGEGVRVLDLKGFKGCNPELALFM